MPIVQYSRKDLLRDKIVNPAWYLVLIETIGEWTDSRDGKSQNMIVEGVIVKNAETGATDFADVPIGGMGSWNFNTKAMGFSKGLVNAVANQLGLNPDEITPETRIEFKHLEGKYVEVFIENDTYEGRIKNKVQHKYREPKSLVA